ncbi:MAG: cation transporter [Deltaproteobacteria bacterium]|nr:cation transporter [Deltaproteobacteria bacterium]
MEHHNHNHTHGSVRETGKSRLRLVLVLTSLFFVVEVFGGLWTNSLALLSDAGHMLSDMFALGLSLFAFWLSSRKPSPTKTYGYYRFEVVAAFINGVLLILIALWIFGEAYSRFQEPAAVKTVPMLVIAVLGLMINLLGIYLLHEIGTKNINIRGALFHLIGDAAGSVGAIAAAIAISLTGWTLFDPLVSVLIGLLIIYSAWRLLWDVVNILMQGVPPHIDLDSIRQGILSVDGVIGVCDLHIWSLTSEVESLSAHVVVEDMGRNKEILEKLTCLIRDRFGINHVTLQIEDEAVGTCKLFPEEI